MRGREKWRGNEAVEMVEPELDICSGGGRARNNRGRKGRGCARAFMSDVTTDKRKRRHRGGVGERVQRRVEGRRAAGQCQDDVSFYLPPSAAAEDGGTMKGQKVPPSPFDLRRRRRRSQRHTDAHSLSERIAAGRVVRWMGKGRALLAALLTRGV